MINGLQLDQNLMQDPLGDTVSSFFTKAAMNPKGPQSLPKNFPSFGQSDQIANLFGNEIDRPTSTSGSQNPSFGYSPFNTTFRNIIPNQSAYSQNIGVTQNPPRYRGIRLTLPQSGGGYQATAPNNPYAQALQQQVYGRLISRGYPLYGGMGQLQGFQPGFNPIGFGQR